MTAATLAPSGEAVRLTEYARCAGCAAKLGPADLSAVLRDVPSYHDPRLVIGRETFDDAGVFMLGPELALVQTIDFFAPIVDDPYSFGQVAAANALSDVFAMGGTPLTALAIVCFPIASLPTAVLSDILRGAQDKVREAGAVLVGGHTIIDEELKFGLSVTGQVHPSRILSNASAAIGDILVLTKPLGTGLLATAAKRNALGPVATAQLLHSMVTLNDVACCAAVAAGITCATDVTGFGLLGHGSHIARASNVTLEFSGSALPELTGARDLWRAGNGTSGAERNEAYLAPLANTRRAGDEDRALALDPQTSGGLLLSMHASLVDKYIQSVPGSVVVGRVTARGSALVVLA